MLIVSPSTKERTETSRPVMNSSMTISLPAVPNFLSSMIVFTPSLCFFQHLDRSDTPFPSARPSAFKTIGNFAVSKICERFVRIGKILIGCGRNIVFLHQILGKCLGSFQNRRIFSSVRIHGVPAASNTSTRPPTSGSSMPTITVRSICMLFCKCRQLIKFHRTDRHTLCILLQFPHCPVHNKSYLPSDS